MFRHSAIRIVGQLLEQRYEAPIAAVAHRYHRVPPQAGTLGAPDRRTAESGAKVLGREVRQPRQRRMEALRVGLELGCRGSGSLAVPGADVLANVAAEDVVSHA